MTLIQIQKFEFQTAKIQLAKRNPTWMDSSPQRSPAAVDSAQSDSPTGVDEALTSTKSWNNFEIKVSCDEDASKDILEAALAFSLQVSDGTCVVAACDKGLELVHVDESTGFEINFNQNYLAYITGLSQATVSPMPHAPPQPNLCLSANIIKNPFSSSVLETAKEHSGPVVK